MRSRLCNGPVLHFLSDLKVCTVLGMDITVGVEDLRKELGKRVEAAHHGGEVTVITKGNGKEPYAVIVPYDWYREAEGRRTSMIAAPGAGAGAEPRLDAARHSTLRHVPGDGQNAALPGETARNSTTQHD